jgi:4-hydroxy-4-methyl-2-oxoglutarate aldolase
LGTSTSNSAHAGAQPGGNSGEKQDEGVARASKLDTSTISDALDRLGIAGQCLNIKPRDPSFRMTGRAFTLYYAPAGKPAGTVGEFIDAVPAGSVVAIDNGGRENATVWGDILTEIAHRRGLAGTVIDGACRDTALCMALGYPVYSKSYSMRTGKDRVQLDATQVTVNIGNARVSPGDLLRGDADGVVVIPQQHEAEVLAAAEQIDKAEEAIRKAVRDGKPLAEARKEFGYHQLQTKK